MLQRILFILLWTPLTHALLWGDVSVRGKSIVFSGDMNDAYHTLETLAKHADMLVAHHAVPKETRGVAAQLHMTPQTIGRIAQKAKVRQVILSHRMLRTIGKERESRIEIRKHYHGKLKFANDLDLYTLQ